MELLFVTIHGTDMERFGRAQLQATKLDQVVIDKA